MASVRAHFLGSELPDPFLPIVVRPKVDFIVRHLGRFLESAPWATARHNLNLRALERRSGGGTPARCDVIVTPGDPAVTTVGKERG